MVVLTTHTSIKTSGFFGDNLNYCETFFSALTINLSGLKEKGFRRTLSFVILAS